MSNRNIKLLTTVGICCSILIVILLFVFGGNKKKRLALEPAPISDSMNGSSREDANIPGPQQITDSSKLGTDSTGKTTGSPKNKEVVAARGKTPTPTPAATPGNVVNVKGFGAKGDGITDDLPAMKKALQSAISKGLDLYIPPGNYRLTGYFPLRNTANKALLDCRSITIYGDGTTSHVFTSGPSGIDVFQMNAVKNVTIKNLRISSKVTGSNYKHGSNAVSITGGGENIRIENLFIADLPIVKYSDHIDGGKGVTIQPANTQNPTRNISISNCNITGCAYGIGIDLSGNMVVNNPLSNIKITNNNINSCWRGVSIGATDAQKLEDGLSRVSITVSDNTIVDCNSGIMIARAGNLKVLRNNVRKKAALKENYARYRGKDPAKSYGILALGLINSVIEGNQISCDGCEGELAIGSINSSLSKVKSSAGNQISRNKLTGTKVKFIDNNTVKAANKITE